MKIRLFFTMLLTCTVVFIPLHAQVVDSNAMTRRAGPPALIDHELRFKKALGEVTTYRFDPNELLCLSDDSGRQSIRFSAQNQ